jgi:small conductance mechanosensitive channel
MQVEWSKISGFVIPFAINLSVAVVIFLVGKWLAHIVSRLFEGTMQRAKVNKTLSSFTKNLIYYGILVFVAIASLNKLGIETSSFVAIIGAAGLAVGLALQGTLANFAAGVMIILFQPFGVGDMIEAGGAVGLVEEIQIFSTVLMAADKKRIIVPNAKITADKIVIHPKG